MRVSRTIRQIALCLTWLIAAAATSATAQPESGTIEGRILDETGAILPGAFDLTAFVANSAALLLSTILWTWIVHGAGNSIFCAILLHATSNATSALIPELVATPDDAWLVCKILAPWVAVVILATRGRLGYRPEPTV